MFDSESSTSTCAYNRPRDFYRFGPSPASVGADVDLVRDVYSPSNYKNNNNNNDDKPLLRTSPAVVSPTISESAHQHGAAAAPEAIENNGYSPLDGELIDPSNGIPDIYVRTIAAGFGDDVDLYRDVLHVPRTVSEREIRVAYFRRGREVLSEGGVEEFDEPANLGGVPNRSKLRFQAVSMAHEILTRPEWRDEYDNCGLPVLDDPDDCKSIDTKEFDQSLLSFSSAMQEVPASLPKPTPHRQPVVRWSTEVEELVYEQDPDELTHRSIESVIKRRKKKRKPKIVVEDEKLDEHLAKLDAEAQTHFVNDFFDELEASIDGLLKYATDSKSGIESETDSNSTGSRGSSIRSNGSGSVKSNGSSIKSDGSQIGTIRSDVPRKTNRTPPPVNNSDLVGAEEITPETLVQRLLMPSKSHEEQFSANNVEHQNNGPIPFDEEASDCAMASQCNANSNMNINPNPPAASHTPVSPTNSSVAATKSNFDSSHRSEACGRIKNLPSYKNNTRHCGTLRKAVSSPTSEESNGNNVEKRPPKFSAATRRKSKRPHRSRETCESKEGDDVFDGLDEIEFNTPGNIAIPSPGSGTRSVRSSAYSAAGSISDLSDSVAPRGSRAQVAARSPKKSNNSLVPIGESFGEKNSITTTSGRSPRRRGGSRGKIAPAPGGGGSSSSSIMSDDEDVLTESAEFLQHFMAYVHAVFCECNSQDGLRGFLSAFAFSDGEMDSVVGALQTEIRRSESGTIVSPRRKRSSSRRK